MEPHVSIMADITCEELNMTLTTASKYNGFANRFLWVYVTKTQLLPFGGEAIDWTPETKELGAALRHARGRERVFMDNNARKMWKRIYERKDKEISEAGSISGVINRAAPQIYRLALIYCLLDMAEHVTSAHLEAAEAVWDYCEDSARMIFHSESRTQQAILSFCKTGPKTASDVREAFHRHRKIAEIQSDLDLLVMAGRLKKDGELYSFVSQSGA
jgi:hypothetical protein